MLIRRRRMPQLLLLAALLALTTGCGTVQSSEGRASDAAQEVARKAGERLYGQRVRTAAEAGYITAGLDGVEVLRMTGTSTHHGDGLEMVVRTSGSAFNPWLDAQEVTVRRCFTVRVSPETKWREEPHEVDCPDGPPLAFAPPPAPPRLPHQELRAKLPKVAKGGRVNEAEVRRAVAALNLVPPIRTEVKADDGMVGVLLSVRGNRSDPQDCLLARVEPGATEVWVPPRIQRMPGEGGCTVGNALHPLPPPH
ncbi:translation initiation factor IF-2 [Streptomyces sp. NPDC051561]|uniref:translation initiation factor IF-2 n=1 Tax=Streptomyces sp. NPDC051561 TaxID=3365658 RepID=UPI0037919CB3